MGFSKRQLDLIGFLAEEASFVNSDELADLFSVTSRTIKTDLKVITDMSELHGFQIQTSSAGYKLNIMDFNRFDESRQLFLNKIDFNFSIDRVRYIISKLIIKNLEIEESYLLNSLNISVRTLVRDMQNVEEILKSEGLTLKKIDGCYVINGNEKSIRSFLTKYVDIDLTSIDNYNRLLLNYEFDFYDIQLLSNKIVGLLHSHKKNLIGINVTNLIIHIIVSIYRIKNGFVIQEIKVTNEMHLLEFEIAKKMTDIINECFNVEFPDSEIVFLAYSMIGKGFSETRSREVIQLIENTYNDIKSNFNIELNINNEYSNALYYHIVAMKDRIKYGITIDSSIIEMVKAKFILAYEMAVLLHHNYYRKYNIALNDVEVSYIALHFGAMINSQNQKEHLPRSIVVTEARTGNALFLKNELLSKFHEYVCIEGVYSPFELSLIDINEYDYIFSTIKLNQKDFQAHIIVVPTVLDDTSVDIIMRKLKIRIETKEIFFKELYFHSVEMNLNIEDILKERCDLFLKQKLIKNAEEFYQLTIIRENLQSTHIAEKVALPHPMSAIAEKSFISTLIFSNGIRWFDDQMVYLVFYIGINPKEKE